MQFVKVNSSSKPRVHGYIRLDPWPFKQQEIEIADGVLILNDKTLDFVSVGRDVVDVRIDSDSFPSATVLGLLETGEVFFANEDNVVDYVQETGCHVER